MYTAPVSSAEQEQQAPSSSKRLNLLSGFTRKKHVQRQAQASHAISTTSTSPVPDNQHRYVSAAVPAPDTAAAAAAGHKRAATSLGHSAAAGGNNNGGSSSSNRNRREATINGVNNEPVRPPFYAQHHPRQTSLDKSLAASTSKISLFTGQHHAASSYDGPRHSNDLGTRTGLGLGMHNVHSRAASALDTHSTSHHAHAVENLAASHFRQDSQYSQHEQLADTIIRKITSRLPHRTSENCLSTLHTDEHGIKELIASLHHLTRHRLSYILQQLNAELDLVIKLSNSQDVPSTSVTGTPAASLHHSQYQQPASFKCLMSQAIILQMMAGCLDWHRRSTQTQIGPLNDKTAKQLLATVTYILKQYYHGGGYHFDSRKNNDNSASQGSSSNQQQQPSRNSESSVNASSSQIMPARFAQEPSASTSSSTSGFSRRFRHNSNSTPNATSAEQNARLSYTPLLRTIGRSCFEERYKLFSDTLPKRNVDTNMKDCLASCTTIVEYLSLTRWDLIMLRIRSKLNQWSNASAGSGTNPDEIPDMSDLHLLEFSALDDSRLANMLSELSSTFASLRKPIQPIIAILLHDILRQFLSTNPRIIQTMYEDGKRPAFAGQSEALFDTIFSVGDTIKKRMATWPTLAALLPLCPEIVMQIAMGGGDARSPTLSKKVLFLDALRKAVHSSRASMAPIGKSKEGQNHQPLSQEARLAMMCYVEMCTAASYARPSITRPPSPLWTIADTMRAELRSCLRDPARTCAQHDGSVDIQLVSEAASAVARMAIEDVTADILPSLLAPEAMHSLKLAGLEAMNILLENTKGENVAVRNACILPVTKLLHQAVISTFNIDASGKARIWPVTEQARQIMADIESERNQIIVAILQLLLVDPRLLLHRHPDAPAYDTVYTSIQSEERLVKFRPGNQAQIFALIVCLMQEDNHRDIQRAVVDLLLTLQARTLPHPSDEDLRSETGQPALVRSLYANIDPIALALARPSLFTRESLAEDKEVLKAYLIFLKNVRLTMKHIAATTHQLEITLQFAELIGLWNICSLDAEVQSIACQILSKAASLMPAVGAMNSNLHALANAISQEQGPVVGGAVAHMKRLKKIFTSISIYTPALAASWSDLSKRWKRCAAAFGLSGPEPPEADKTIGGIGMPFMQSENLPNEDHMTEWIQLSGFLCRTAFIVFSAPHDARSLTDAVHQDYLPPWLCGSASFQGNVTELLSGLVRLLSSNHARIRDATREQLGSDLAPELLPYILSDLASQTDSMYSARQLETATDSATLHFDQSLSVMAQSFSRLVAPFVLSAESCGQIERHLLAAAYYVLRMESTAVTTRLKIKICQASYAILARRKISASLLNDRFRNALAIYLLAFANDCNSEEIPEKSRLELELHSLEALASCLDGLIIRRTSSAPPVKDSVPDAALLNTYFRTLSRILYVKNTLTAEDAERWQGHNSHKIAGQPKNERTPDTTTVVDTIVKALANLLVSNVPVSTSLLMELCRVRDDAVFDLQLKVVRATLAQMGSMLQAVADTGLHHVIELIAAPDLSLALTIVDICLNSEHEALLDILMQVLDSRGLEIDLLKALISQEVHSTDHEFTLFRGNSAATRLLTAFARKRGYSYLRFLVSNLLSTLAQQPLDLSDLSMYNESEEDDETVARLENLAEAFLSLICETWHLVPLAMQNLCQHIQCAVRERFPDSVYTAIGGWMFLRYINPAIISPELVDLEMPEDSRKVLVMISKLLQALSNNIRFKEPGMRSFNGFISKHILDMTGFLTQISSRLVTEATSVVQDELGISLLDREALLLFLWQNKEQIGSKLLARPATQAQYRHSSVEAGINITQQVWNRFTEGLCRSLTSDDVRGVPSLPHDDFTSSRHQDIYAQPTMLSSGLVNTDCVSSFDAPSGRTIICIGVRVLLETQGSLEGLIGMLQQRIDNLADSVEVLVDLTSFQTDKHPSLASLRTLACKATDRWSAQVKAIHLFCPSSAALLFVKRCAGLVPRQLEVPLTCLETTSAVEDQLGSPGQALSADSLARVGADRKHVTDAVVVLPDGTHSSCRVYAGLEDLLIKTTRPRIVYNDVKCCTSDFFEAHDIISMRRKHSFYGTQDVEIVLANGSPIVLLEVSDLEALVITVRGLRNPGPLAIWQTSPDLATVTDVAPALLAGSLCALASYDEASKRLGVSILYHLCRLSGLVEERLLHPYNAICVPEVISDVLARYMTHEPSQMLALLTGSFENLAQLKDLSIPILVNLLKPVLHLLSHASASSSKDSRRRFQTLCQHIIHMAVRHDASKLWPSLLNPDFAIPIFIDEIVAELSSLNYSKYQRGDLCRLVTQFRNMPAVRCKLMSMLKHTLAAVSSKETVAMDQAEEWISVVSLLQIDAAVSAKCPVTSQLQAADVLWLYSMVAGLGDAGMQAQVWTSMQAFLCSLDLANPISRPSSIHLSALQSAWDKLNETQSMDVVEQLQLGRVPHIPAILQGFFEQFVTLTTYHAPSTETAHYWVNCCALRSLRCAESATGLLQYRSLLLLSCFTHLVRTLLHLRYTQAEWPGVQDSPVLRTLLRTIRGSLAENINSNTLQAYLFCFTSCLRNVTDASEASLLFWLAIVTAQAHPLLFATSVRLLEAAVLCIKRVGLPDKYTLSRFLLEQRNQSEEGRGAADDFEDMLECHFNDENFSFALASLVVKGLFQEDARSVTINLLLVLAAPEEITLDEMANVPNGSEEQQPVNLASLGYCTALLSVAACEAVDALECQAIARLLGWTENPVGPMPLYQPILDKIDVDRNEPLVLAAAMTLGLLKTTETEPGRIILLKYLGEIAEISPAVILLISDDLIPVLDTWLQDSSNCDLLSVANDLLQHLVSAGNGVDDVGNADISAYVTALGLPRLLECASFSEFTASASQNTDMARQKLRCCADLLGAFDAAS